MYMMQEYMFLPVIGIIMFHMWVERRKIHYVNDEINHVQVCMASWQLMGDKSHYMGQKTKIIK